MKTNSTFIKCKFCQYTTHPEYESRLIEHILAAHRYEILEELTFFSWAAVETDNEN